MRVRRGRRLLGGSQTLLATRLAPRSRLCRAPPRQSSHSEAPIGQEAPEPPTQPPQPSPRSPTAHDYAPSDVVRRGTSTYNRIFRPNPTTKTPAITSGTRTHCIASRSRARTGFVPEGRPCVVSGRTCCMWTPPDTRARWNHNGPVRAGVGAMPARSSSRRPSPFWEPVADDGSSLTAGLSDRVVDRSVNAGRCLDRCRALVVEGSPPIASSVPATGIAINAPSTPASWAPISMAIKTVRGRARPSCRRRGAAGRDSQAAGKQERSRSR